MRRKAISLSKAGGLFLAGLTVRAVAFHPAPCVAPALGGDLPLGLGSRSAPRLRQTAAMSGVRRRAASCRACRWAAAWAWRPDLKLMLRPAAEQEPGLREAPSGGASPQECYAGPMVNL